jgi:NADH:ubiquinone oxidoreductase subunit 5 (subunit L)/multisubunit Na+/H+ antiporter MnhA subunit
MTKMIKSYTKALFVPVVFLIGIIVLTYLIYVWLDNRLSQENTLHKELIAKIQKIDKDLQHANSQRSIYQKYNDKFTKLLKNKIDTKADRVYIAQSLQLIADKLNFKKNDFIYNINKIKQIGKFNEILLHGLDVQLEINMLHEMILLDVFAALNSLPGTFATKKCHIEKLLPNIQPQQKNFKATCLLEWFFVDLGESNAPS